MSGLTQWPTAPEFFAGMKKHFGIDRGANKFLDAAWQYAPIKKSDVKDINNIYACTPSV